MRKHVKNYIAKNLQTVFLTVVVCTLLISLPIAALADGALSITDSGLTLTGDWSQVEGSTNSFTKTVSTSSCDAVSSTLTISVAEGKTGILEFSFDTTYTGTDGSYEIKHGSTTLTGDNGKYTVSDFSSANNVTIKISTSAKKNSSKTGTVSGVTFTEKKTVSVQFMADPLGIMTYTVDGQSIGNPISKETGITVSYAITNSTDSNYVLAGWHWTDGTDEGYYSVGSAAQRNNATGTVPIMGAYTVTPVVAYYTGDSAPWKADNEYWWTWETAMSAALGSTDKIVTQMVDHTLPANLAQNGLKANGKYVTYDANAKRMTYTIPSGAKLLVPYNANDTGDFDATPTMRNPGSASSITCYPNDPIMARDPSVYDTMTRYGKSGGIDKLLETVGKEVFAKGMYAYRTLTVPANTTIDVQGALNVNSRVFVFGHHETGTPASTHGQIKLETATSTINVTGTLYCYGFITGEGTVNNYGHVYELLQLVDWRGAAAATAWESSGTTNFLFSQYYVQNIECSYVVNNGSLSHAVVSLAVSKVLVQQNRPFIGNKSTSGFFTLTDGKITRNYVPSTERIVYSVEGDLSMDSITIEQDGLKFTSSDYILPLQNNLEINLISGTTTITNDVKMLPNSSITVGKDARLIISEDAELYIYDKNDWKASSGAYYTLWLNTGTQNYGASSYSANNSELYDNYGVKALTVRYSPTRGNPTATPTEVSAKLVVNGTLEAYGNIFASEHTTAATLNGTDYDTDTGTDANKILFGSTGTFINHTNSDSASWAVPQLMETIQKDQTKAADGHVKVNSIPVVAKLAGITSGNAYTSMGIGTYHALSKNYWYNYKVTSADADKITVTSTLAADSTAGDDLVGYVSYYTVDDTNTQSAFTFTVADGYKVSAKTVVNEVETVTELTPDDSGVYSLTNVTADTVLVLSSSCDHTTPPEESAVKFQWANDYTSCTVSYTCPDCQETITPEDVTLTHEKTVTPTCTAEGEKTHTATVTIGSSPFTNTQTETLVKRNHNYSNFKFNWADDCSSCTVSYSCADCGDPVNNATCNVAKTAETSATCTSGGSTTYTASITVYDTEQTNTTTLTTAALGHKVSGEDNAVTFEWNGYTSCTASYRCTTCDATVTVACNMGEPATTPASCTSPGKTVYTATATINRANYTDTEEVAIPASGHKFTTYTHHTDATCKEFATEIASCDYGCGTTNTRTYGEKLNHSYGDYASNGDATCTENGTQTRTCSVCGDKQTVEVENSKLGHACIYTSNNDATCTVDGTKTGKCSRCDYSETVTDTGSAKGHSFTNYELNNDAKCGVDGTKTATCDNGCGETNTITAEGTALAHQFGEYVSDGNATCISDGTKTRECTSCGDKETVADTGSKLGHSFTNYVYNSDATCTKNGTETAKCDRCDVTDTRERADSKLPHSYGDYVSNNNASCTANATQTAKCKNCDATDTVDIPDTKLDHVFTNYVSNNNATCQADGTKTASCDNGCGTTNTIADEGTQKPHTEVTDAAVAPTCTTTGLSEGKHCSVCGTVTVAQTVVAANGHKDEVVTVDPTCTADGSKTFTCTVCGDIRTKAIPATGHTAVTDDAIAPTCTETGLTAGSHCSVCNTVLVAQEEVAALGHKEVVDEAVAATCSATGLTEGSHCSVCDTVLVKQETVAKLPHTPGETVIENKTDATCTTPGSYDEVTYCTVCKGEASRNTVTVPQNGHNYGGWTQTSAPTCSTTGVKTRTCSVCGNAETEVIPTTGHTNGDAVVENYTKPTVATTGQYDSVVYCSGCSTEMSRTTITLPEAAKLAAINASAADEIVLKLMFFLPENFLNDEGAYVSIVKEGKSKVTKTMSSADLIAQGTDENGRYVLTMGAASGEMTSPITVEFVNGSGEKLSIIDYMRAYQDTELYETSVQRKVIDYSRLTFEKGSEKQKTMMVAMLTYGGYAQIQFQCDQENPAYNILSEYNREPLSLENVSFSNTMTKSGADIGITVLNSQRAYLDSNIYLRVYFTLEDGANINDYSFTLTRPGTDTNTAESIAAKYEASKNRYYVDITDIPAAYLDNNYTITVVKSGESGSYSVSTNVLVYLTNLINSDLASEDQKNQAKAMYLYNQAANTFFKK